MQNQFGAAVGGPLVKNRTFWFADYQAARIRDGSLSSTLTIPTAQIRGGDFSVLPTGIYNPASERTVNGVLVRDQFANGS